MTGIINKENAIADYLLAECKERGELLTNLKLQKLLYYAQAWSLALRDKELFDEDFKAWVHGPVLLSQYHRFKNNGWYAITDCVGRPALDESEVKHLDEIVDVFGPETAVALELMTHREKPWLDARGDLAPHEPSTSVITKQSMREFYKSI